MSLRILLVENVHEAAKDRFLEEGFTNIHLLRESPSPEELNRLLPNYDVVGIRSKTHLDAKVLRTHRHLLAVGAFCIGTNQIHLNEANALGIPVFNAPYSNTRSVAEMVIAEMICLARQLGDRSASAHQGGWMKSAEGAYEVRGKTLGIVGYGHIGSQVSVLAEGLGMKVYFYDIVKKLPLGNARPLGSLNELLPLCDFVTLHVPETPFTRNMMGKAQFFQMKPGSYFINAARGTTVLIDDLAQALQTKHLGGCAIDVFPEEPASNAQKFMSPLQNLPNVILTPHIGGSTQEAQYSIGLEVTESLIRYLKWGSTVGAVNFPHVDLPIPPPDHLDHPSHSETIGVSLEETLRKHEEKESKGRVLRILNVHSNEPGVLGEINGAVSRHQVNIRSQSLATDDQIGYLIMDLEREEGQQEAEEQASLVEELRKLPRSLRTRALHL